MPETTTTIPIDQLSAPSEFSQEAANAAIQEAAAASSVESTIYPDAVTKESGEIRTMKGEGRQHLGQEAPAPKAPALPAEERPDYIPAEQWKGTLKATYEAAASAAYLKSKQAEKKPEAPKAGTSPLDPDLLKSVTQEMVAGRGKVSDATLEKLKATGLPEEVIQSHLAGYEHMLERNTLLAIQEAGGEENYTKMMEWFETLPPAEKNMIAPGFTSPDKEVVKASAKLALSRFQQAQGGTITAGYAAGNQSGPAPFRNSWELAQAMGDIRWTNHEVPGSWEYRQEVHARIAASHQAGVRIG